MYAVSLGLELALPEIVQSPVEAGKRVERALDSLNEIVVDIRAYIFDLRPVRLDGDLLTDLAATVQEFRENSPLQITVAVPVSISRLREDRALAMVHIAREGLSNARKHAQASGVQVAIGAGDDCVDMEIHDDGIGFDQSAESPHTHRGLRNMRQRTQHLGGSFDIESAPGAGTVLRVRMPAGS